MNKPNKDTAMMKKLLSNALLVALVVLTTSCTDPFWEGRFSSDVYFVNNTNSDIVAEYENVEIDTTYMLVIPPFTSQNNYDIYIRLGECQADKKDKWPPEEFVAEKMNHLTLYRMVGDTRQYLPRTCYDESSDFVLGADYEPDIHYVKYVLYISEDMFSDTVVKE